jgi:hypothetical protein
LLLDTLAHTVSFIPPTPRALILRALGVVGLVGSMGEGSPPAPFFQVRKTPLFEPFVYKNNPFTKTGSGQTQKKRPFYQDRLGTNIGKR